MLVHLTEERYNMIFIELHKASSVPAPKLESHEEEEAQPEPTGDVKGRQRRGAVSAEVYSEEDIANYVKKIVPKDDDTKKALERSMCHNVLFAHLDENEKKYNYNFLR
ncbi:unnamed protein product [Soboliphyme baturini]|uniref:Transcription initiation factor TFIID subunit 7 n=1 Tax=Soboliphyme baturini TaxID=241478 RepID=A0A183IY44_9BILA|nr:unnamed protein product [Soboliphyme baturini]